MRPVFQVALLLSLAVLTDGCDRSSSAKEPNDGITAGNPDPPKTSDVSPQKTPVPAVKPDPVKDQPPSKSEPSAKDADDVPHVTLDNAKELVREADSPVLMFLYHSSDKKVDEHWKIIQDQITVFKAEKKRYPTGVAFRLMDLDSKDGAEIGAVLLKNQTERLKNQIKVSSAYLFYFPGKNGVVLITVSKNKTQEDENVVPLLTGDVLEAYVYQQLSLKPTAVPKKP